MTFRIPITVRSYELDSLGHVNQAVYHQYAEVARMSAFGAAGCAWADLRERDLGPVLLSSTIHYRRELRAAESVEVSCTVKFGTGKSFAVDSVITKADGTVAAEIYCVVGLMDLRARRLVTEPRSVLIDAGYRPEVVETSD
ncbi:thioesterase [Actinophytocola xinjiangensis]|uniref:Thioesterase n=1 Tax=Actinophytocola xinjiangensis TaxID=485602 RepID=A0A7Z1AXB2_9PSEU|nr:acyl-CoA thioesterase [Actinophytocola xinjiangensis]OLF08983.1 thioesterase [Actinophytocola xinjiangensis]